MRTLILIVILLLAGVGVFAAWEAFTFFSHRSPTSQAGLSPEEDKFLLDVPPGRTFGAVAQELYQKEMISNPLYFRIFARLTVGGHNMKVGEYELHRAMGPGDILSTITSGVSYARTFTIPEGTNMYDIALLLESRGLGASADFLKLFKDRAFIKELLGEEVYSLEGYLYPETYHFTKYTGQREIVRAMVRNFLTIYDQIKAPEKTNFTRHQVVTIASVIEKETGAPEERPLIASVFLNRLRIPMRLQSDPTILYGILDQTGQMKKNITRSDLLTPTRYNTYTVNGLPFGPIANPGREALRAVFEPAQSKFLYFVSRNDGTHVFSENLQQHNQAVRKFQLDAKARQGKSWRDLQKRAQ